MPAPLRPISATRWPRSMWNVASCTSSRPATRHRQALRLHHHPPAARGRREVELERPLLARALDPLDPSHRLQLALRLARLGAVAKAVDEPLQVRQLLLLALVLAGLRRHPLGPLQPPVGVAALRHAPPAALQLQHAGGHRLQEPAIVRHEDQRRVEPVQVLLQPLDRVDVEVVGGLVQQQQVGLAGQRPRQRGPGQLAAGEGVQLPLEVLRREAEAARDPLQARAPGVAAGPLEGRLGGPVVAQRGLVAVALGHSPLDPAQIGLELGRGGGALAHVVAQRDAPAQRRPLVVQRHAGAAGQRHGAALRLQLAGDDPQQRGLAGAVAPHQRHAVARPHDRGHVAQHLVAAEGEADLGQVERHSSTTLPNRSGCSSRACAAAASSSGYTLSTTGRHRACRTCSSSWSNSRGLPMVVPSRFHWP